MTGTELNEMAAKGSGGGQYDVYVDEPPGGGWLFFAGTVLGLAGLMRIVDAVWAFGYKGALPDGLADGVLGDNIKNYAWLWLVVGAALILSSFLVLTGSQIARWVGFFAAGIMAISAMTWMPYYPVWSLVYIVIAVLVFHALSRYGGRQAV